MATKIFFLGFVVLLTIQVGVTVYYLKLLL
jgi:hypothetical protein